MTHRSRVSLEEAATAVVRRLRDEGFEALWAGGCVRDMLLSRPPTDIDIATNARPDKLIQLFKRTRHVGVQFGVVLVRQGPYWLEVATFRSDVNYQDGRHPTAVVFTDAREDSQRRDFTINGLFYDPISERVIDYVGGQADLQAGVIRAIGEPEQRFAEDHLRLLRAVRFAARLNFQIDPVTADAIRNCAPSLGRISAERIREELQKMFLHPARSQAFSLLAEVKLLEQLPFRITWTPQATSLTTDMLAAVAEPCPLPLALATILHTQSAAHAEQVARDLRCSNQEIDELGWLVGNYRKLDDAAALALPAFKRLGAHPCFGLLLALHAAYLSAYHQPLESNLAARTRLAAIPADQLTPPPFVTGDDLIALGLQPGPRFKNILAAVYDAQLNGDLADRPAALAQMRELLR